MRTWDSWVSHNAFHLGQFQQQQRQKEKRPKCRHQSTNSLGLRGRGFICSSSSFAVLDGKITHFLIWYFMCRAMSGGPPGREKLHNSDLKDRQHSSILQGGEGGDRGERGLLTLGAPQGNGELLQAGRENSDNVLMICNRLHIFIYT